MKTVFKSKPINPLRVGLWGLSLSLLSLLDAQDSISTDLTETTLVGAVSDGLESVLSGANTIEAEILDARNAEDFEDLFKGSLEIRAGGGRSQSQDVFIQGLQTTMANVTIDGAPQSGLIFYHAGSGGTIEPELLKSVTVSAGVSSALSGPGALGGGLSYETKDGFDLLSGNATWGAQLKETFYFSADNGNKSSLIGYGLLGKKWSYLAAVGYADVGNYSDGNGVEVIDTKYVRKNALLKVSGYLSEGHFFGASYEYIEDEGAGGARFNVYPDEASDLANYKTRNTFTLHYDYDPIGNDLIHLQIHWYHTERTLEGSDEVNGITTRGFDVRNESLLVGNELSLVYGFDYRLDSATSDLAKSDEKGSILGSYVQADWNVAKFFTLSTGARYDIYELNPREGQNLEHSGFSPNITGIYKIGAGLNLHATYARAFRGAAPIMSKLTTATTDPDMVAEKARNIEVGVDYSFGVFFVAGKIFESNVDDLINPRPRGTARTNIGDLESTGFELMAGVNSEKFRFNAGVIESDPQITTPDGTVYDEYVSVNSKTGRTWMGNLEYLFPATGLSLGWYVEYVERQRVVGSRSTREKTSTLVHDIFVRWQPTLQSLDGLSLNFSVNNVFDKAYYDQSTFAYASGYAAPGRDLRLSLQYQF